MPYAQITLAISDQCLGGLEGFASLSGPLPATVFADAIEDAQSGGVHTVFLDLMEGEEQLNEKCISLGQAARILRAPVESLVPLGRQRLAQIDDEAAEYLANRRS